MTYERIDSEGKRAVYTNEYEILSALGKVYVDPKFFLEKLDFDGELSSPVATFRVLKEEEKQDA